MEIHTSLDEIIDTLKKLKDAVPADFRHEDIVKQDSVTVTIETNLRQGEAVVKEEAVTLTATIGTNFRQDYLETEEGRCHRDGENNEALSEREEGRIIDF